MSDPSPFDGLSFIVLGGLGIAFRRSLARALKRSQDTFDRAFNEDGLAWFNGILGAVGILIGVVLLLLWATA